jgi:hypothetical protein
VLESGKEELYDVSRDPFELNDLSGDPDHSPVLERMRLLARGRDAELP